jgi:hypothetical protein
MALSVKVVITERPNVCGARRSGMTAVDTELIGTPRPTRARLIAGPALRAGAREDHE